MSYRQIFYQIIFGTKHRKRTIAEQNCELADYIKDIKVASNGWMKSSGLFPDFEG